MAGLDLNPSSNLLLPPTRLCELIGPMWHFVMATEPSLIFVKVSAFSLLLCGYFLRGQCGLEFGFKTECVHCPKLS